MLGEYEEKLLVRKVVIERDLLVRNATIGQSIPEQSEINQKQLFNKNKRYGTILLELSRNRLK